MKSVSKNNRDFLGKHSNGIANMLSVPPEIPNNFFRYLRGYARMNSIIL
jgi:hypothetical protein